MTCLKLETNPAVLIEKSRAALNAYGIDVVVGNILESRYRNLLLVDSTTKHEIEVKDDNPIEVQLVQALILRHKKHIETMESKPAQHCQNPPNSESESIERK